MPKLIGVFDLFEDLDKISDEDLLNTMQFKMDHHSLTNFLGNRILYPQTVATTKQELAVDFAILTLAIRLQPDKVYRKNVNQIIIPYQLIPRFPPMTALVTTFIDNLELEQVTQLWILHSTTTQLIGSVIPKKLLSKIPQSDLENLMVKEELKKMTLGQINLVPSSDKQLMLKFSNGHEFMSFGGELGVFIDLRILNNQTT